MAITDQVTLETRDGRNVAVRPIRLADEAAMLELFDSFSPETVLHRFFHLIPTMSRRDLRRYIDPDPEREVALVAVAQGGKREMLVGVARYAVDPDTGAAEVAFVYHDAWQHQGLGTQMFRQLIEMARGRGITTFVAEIMRENEAMIRLFHTCAEGPVQKDLHDGVYHLAFTVPADAVRTTRRGTS